MCVALSKVWGYYLCSNRKLIPMESKLGLGVAEHTLACNLGAVASSNMCKGVRKSQELLK